MVADAVKHRKNTSSGRLTMSAATNGDKVAALRFTNKKASDLTCVVSY
jgi:hypothetical protein